MNHFISALFIFAQKMFAQFRTFLAFCMLFGVLLNAYCQNPSPEPGPSWSNGAPGFSSAIAACNNILEVNNAQQYWSDIYVDQSTAPNSYWIASCMGTNYNGYGTPSLGSFGTVVEYCVGNLSLNPSLVCVCPSTGFPISPSNFFFSDRNACIASNQIQVAISGNPVNNGSASNYSVKAGDPINAGTGNNVTTQTDFLAAGLLSGLEITRTYNSMPTNPDASTMRSFGTRWTQNYDVRITQLAAPDSAYQLSWGAGICWQRSDTGYVWCDGAQANPNGSGVVTQYASVLRSDGQVLYFTLPPITPNGTASWNPEPGVSGQLTSTFSSDGISVTGYTFTDVDNHVETFDGNGVLLTIVAQGGSTQRLTYSTGVSNDSNAGRYPATAPVCDNVQAGAVVKGGTLLCVTDQWGRQLQFEHDSLGRITKMIWPDSLATVYVYDGPSAGCMAANPAQSPACSSNNLTSIISPDGKTKTLYYNEAAQINGGDVCWSSFPVGNGFGNLLNALTGIVDENGNRKNSWTYNCGGTAISSSLGNGINNYQVALGASNGSGTYNTVVTTPLGSQITYEINVVNGWALVGGVSQPAGSGSAAASSTSAYDLNGNLASHTDFNGNTTIYSYDMTRNLELVRVEASGTELARTITTAWHPSFRLPVQIAEPGRLTTLTYDTNGNLLTKTWQATTDTNGSQGVGATVTGTPRTWTFTYNSVGEVQTAVGPRTDVIDKTQFAYDNHGNLISVTNPANQITTLSSYDMNGHVGTITDPNGLVTTYTYSPRGWLTSQTRGNESTTYNYDGVGQLTSVTFPNGATLTYTYDNAHRLTNIADNLGNSVNYTLDVMGNRTLEQVNDASGNLTRQISRAVDALNRLQEITGAQ